MLPIMALNAEQLLSRNLNKGLMAYLLALI